MEKSKADTWNDDFTPTQDNSHDNEGFNKLEDISLSPCELPAEEMKENNLKTASDKKAAEEKDKNRGKTKEPAKVISIIKLVKKL